MRYLVVGLGNIGAKRVTLLGDRCVGTVDPFNAAADFSLAEACPDDRYDAAVLAVPNDAKLPLLDYFIERGKHVIVEKPLLFPDRATAERVEGQARRRGVVWHTSYNLRFEPHVLALREALAANAIGRLHYARMFYGYGTAASVAGTWRDTAWGALEDLAPHLIDLTAHVFDRLGADFVVWERAAHETKGVDHCVLATSDGKIVLECSLLSWRNRWTIEIVGDRGSLHMDGLTKWGPSELIVRRRRLPSGRPDEDRSVVEMADPTWAREIEHFETTVVRGEASCERDWWLSRAVATAATARLPGDA